MQYKIVSDSSSNILSMEGIPFASVPMKIIAEKEYIDDEGLDLPGMIEDLKNHKGKSGSSCPNVGEWLKAFDGAEMIFGATISKYLSGSYNSAQQAVSAYQEEHPNAKAYIFDSLSTGPEQAMILDKAAELAQKGLAFEEITAQVLDYHNHLHTLFCLESLTNLARNGRTSPAVAKIAGMLGIRVCGYAHGGQIEPAQKPRGQKKATQALVDMVVERGFQDGGWMRVAHCYAEDAAREFRNAILARFPNARFTLESTTALCSFYAEVGGLIIGFEGRYNEENNNKEY